MILNFNGDPLDFQVAFVQLRAFDNKAFGVEGSAEFGEVSFELFLGA